MPKRVHQAVLGWLFTPYEVSIVRGATVVQKLSMPDNFANTTRYARALPEAPCAKAVATDVATWPLAQNAFQPNAYDVGQTGTPGAPNDVACPP